MLAVNRFRSSRLNEIYLGCSLAHANFEAENKLRLSLRSREYVWGYLCRLSRQIEISHRFILTMTNEPRIVVQLQCQCPVHLSISIGLVALIKSPGPIYDAYPDTLLRKQTETVKWYLSTIEMHGQLASIHRIQYAAPDFPSYAAGS